MAIGWGNLPRLTRRGATIAVTVALVAVGLGVAVAAVPPGDVRYAAPPAVLVPIAPALPMPAVRGERERVARLTLAEPDVGMGPPRDVDPDLIETAIEGSVPRVAVDGRTSLAHYARPGGAAIGREREGHRGGQGERAFRQAVDEA